MKKIIPFPPNEEDDGGWLAQCTNEDCMHEAVVWKLECPKCGSKMDWSDSEPTEADEQFWGGHDPYLS